MSAVQANSKNIGMGFGMQEWGVLVLKRLEVIKSQEIKLDDGEVTPQKLSFLLRISSSRSGDQLVVFSW